MASSHRPVGRFWLVLTLCFALSLYLVTLFPGVGGRMNVGDAAKWQFVGKVLGVPHATGAPLYVMLTHLWSVVSFGGSLAWRMNLLSALFAVAALGLVFELCRRLLASSTWAALPTMILAFSSTFWMTATEAGPYALQFLLMALVIRLAWRWYETREQRLFLWACFTYALAFGCHLGLITLLPALLYLYLLSDRRVLLHTRVWLLVLCFVCAGAAQYLYILVRAWQGAPYLEGIALETWSGLLDYVTGSYFRARMFNLPLGVVLTQKVPAYLSWLAAQFTFVGLACAALGLAAWLRAEWHLAVFFLLAFVGPLAFAVNYDVAGTQGLFLPSALPVVLFIAYGCKYLLEWWQARRGAVHALLAALPLALLVAVPLYAAVGQFPGFRVGASPQAWIGTLGRSLPAHVNLIWPMDYVERAVLSYFYFGEGLAEELGQRQAKVVPADDRGMLFAQPSYFLGPETRALYAALGIPYREHLAGDGDQLRSYFELPSWQEGERVGGAGRASVTLSSMPDGTAYLAAAGPASALALNLLTARGWEGWEAMPIGPVTAPALASLGKILVAVARGADQHVWLTRNTGSGWQAWSALPESATRVLPAIAAIGQRALLIVRRNDDQLWYCDYEDKKTGAWSRIPDGQATSTPVAVALNEQVWVAVRAKDRRVAVTHYEQGRWAAWESVPGLEAEGAPALAAWNGQLILAVRGVDQALRVNLRGPRGWLGWSPGPSGPSVGSPTLAVADGRLHLAALALDGTPSVSELGFAEVRWDVVGGAYRGEVAVLAAEQTRNDPRVAVDGVIPTSGGPWDTPENLIFRTPRASLTLAVPKAAVVGLLVSADNNDSYAVACGDAKGNWRPLGMIKTHGCGGMQARLLLDGALRTCDRVRISPHGGDGLFAIGEVLFLLERAGEEALFTVPTLLSRGDSLWVVARGPDSEVWVRGFTQQRWRDWGRVAGKRVHAGPVATSVGRHVIVAVTGEDQRVWVNSLAAAGEWSGWRLAADRRITSSPVLELLGEQLFVGGLDARGELALEPLALPPEGTSPTISPSRQRATVIAAAGVAGNPVLAVDGVTPANGTAWDGPRSLVLKDNNSQVTVAVPREAVVGILVSADANDSYRLLCLQGFLPPRELGQLGPAPGGWGMQLRQFFSPHLVACSALVVTPGVGDGSYSIGELTFLVKR